MLCVRSSGNDEQVALKDEACTVITEKPPVFRSCFKRACPLAWTVGSWSKVKAIYATCIEIFDVKLWSRSFRARLCALEAGSFSNLKYPPSGLFLVWSISARPMLLQHSEALHPKYDSNIGLLSILNSRRKAKFLIKSETFCKIYHLSFILTYEQCSVSCGQGIKRRKVACDAVGSEKECDSSAVPISWSYCNKGSCSKIFAIPSKIKVS